MFPDILKIRVLDNRTGRPIPNIAILIKLFAKHKNNYNFIPNFSTQQGIIEISQKWLRQEISKVRNLFPMDYASTLDDCIPKMELKIMDQNEVDRAVNAKRLYQEALNTSEEEIDALSNVNNINVEPILGKVNFQGEKVVEIDLLTQIRS